MTTYYTSDSHFHHKNILAFENRPYGTLEAMNRGLIEEWNSVVKKDDTVYHIGDFVFGSYAKWVEILEQLNGNIILIMGNHDSSKVVKRLLNDGYIKELHEVGIKRKVEGYTLWLSHYPMEIGHRPCKYSIHGHIHCNESSYVSQVNVGVDSPHLKDHPFGQPISEKQLLDILNEREVLVQQKFRAERGLDEHQQEGE